MALAYAPRTCPGADLDLAEPDMAEDTRAPTLEEIHESLEIPGFRAEILRGRIVMSPTPVNRHARAITWFVDGLKEICDSNGWARSALSTVDLVATQERIVPDLLVYPVDDASDDTWLIPADKALLVIEVVSASSRTDDYEVKRQSCALSKIPIYLVVDPQQAALTLCAEPTEEGYQRTVSIAAGGKLELPAPFEITLDTATIPINRRRSAG